MTDNVDKWYDKPSTAQETVHEWAMKYSQLIGNLSFEELKETVRLCKEFNLDGKDVVLALSHYYLNRLHTQN